MDPTMKSNSIRKLLVRVLLVGLLVLVVRSVYVVTVRCDAGADFCFFSGPEGLNVVGAGGINGKAHVRLPDGLSSHKTELRDLWTSREWRKVVDFYSGVFQDLIAEGYLSPDSKVLCAGTPAGQEVFALKEIGVPDSIGVSKKSSPPLVVSTDKARKLFDENTFDFVFTGSIDRALKLDELAAETGRRLKPEGFLIIHTSSAGDLYSFNSLLNLFNCCRVIRSREINGPPDSAVPMLREIVMRKENYILGHRGQTPDGNSKNKCSVPEHKQELVKNAEPLIAEEPLKPWITLKRNIKNIRYLPSRVDISFKIRYVYIDVGARGYGSSIASWFRKQYPKQNRSFEIYAIEADPAFHNEYRKKKGVNLLPYAAWVRNETLFFEINHNPGSRTGDGERGMGRIRPSGSDSSSDVNRIVGFDFADWLKNTVSEKDFVVMKMDVEGTEFNLIPRLFETGAICLIDELFLECHYNRWQKCCPGERSSKYQKTYDQCLELFSSLRESGVLVHQWW